METRIVRSNRRKKTVSARLVGNTMVVNAPGNMPEDRLNELVNNLRKRLERRQLKRELDRKEDLRGICRKLNGKYFSDKIEVRSIEYSTNQSRVFGNCSSRAKTIRISHRVAEMPDWVRDYVVVHEMAHILQPNHSQAFWDIVSRYALAERARGYLLAKGFQSEDNESDFEA